MKVDVEKMDREWPANKIALLERKKNIRSKQRLGSLQKRLVWHGFVSAGISRDKITDDNFGEIYSLNIQCD